MENAAILVLLGIGAYYYLNYKNGKPTYRDVNGNEITSITCGNSITFDVPGHQHVWLSQLKNGQLNFDGPFELPMPAYVLNCGTDVGVYDVAVYALDSNGVKGELLGQTQFTVVPQA